MMRYLSPQEIMDIFEKYPGVKQLIEEIPKDKFEIYLQLENCASEKELEDIYHSFVIIGINHVLTNSYFNSRAKQKNIESMKKWKEKRLKKWNSHSVETKRNHYNDSYARDIYDLLPIEEQKEIDKWRKEDEDKRTEKLHLMWEDALKPIKKAAIEEWANSVLGKWKMDNGVQLGLMTAKELRYLSEKEYKTAQGHRKTGDFYYRLSKNHGDNDIIKDVISVEEAEKIRSEIFD